MFILELLLSQSELTVVLDALNLSSMIGMPKDSFARKRKDRKYLESGVDKLVARNLAARGESNSVSLDADLVAIVKVAADANHAAVFIKEHPGVGRQIFVHGAFNNAVVEHTRPTEDTHRLAVMESQKSLPARWAQIIPIEGIDADGSLECDLLTYQNCVKLVNRGELKDACKVLLKFAKPSVVDQLVTDMAKPACSVNAAILWRENGKIMDARNPMILVGHGQGAWLIHQRLPGDSILRIERTGAEVILTHLVDEWKEVAKSRK